MKTVLAIRHVAFENLGAFEAPLVEAGYRIDYADAGRVDSGALLQPDLLVVLGAPIGACEEDRERAGYGGSAERATPLAPNSSQGWASPSDRQKRTFPTLRHADSQLRDTLRSVRSC